MFTTFGNRVALKTVFAYLIAGILWILLSDYAVNTLPLQQFVIQELQTLKGVLFVILSAILIYSIIYRSVSAQEKILQRLHQKDERIQSIVESAMDAVISFDESQAIILFNSSAERIFGYRSEELMGKPIYTLFPNRFHNIHRSSFQNFITGNIPSKIIGELDVLLGMRFTGEEFPIEASISQVMIKKEKICTIFLRDITERVKYEQTLNEMEERFRLLVDGIKDYAIYLLDTNGCVISWNKGAHAIIGYSTEEIIGKSFSIFYTQQDRDEEIPEESLKQAERNGSFEGEGTRIKKNGSQFIANIVISPLYDSFGKLKGFAKITRDVTEQKNAQRNLLHEKNFSESLLNSLPGVFYLFNKQGKYLRWNKNFEEVSGYSFDEIEKLHPLDFFDPEQKKHLQQRIELAFEYGATDVETNIRTKNGSSIPYYFTGKRIEINGETCLIGMGIDVTEKNKIKSALEETQEKLLHTMENMSDAFVSLDRNWCYTFMNDAAGKIFSRDPKTMIGKHIWTEFPEGIGQPFHKAYERAMNDGEFILLEEYYTPYDMWFENRIYPTDDGISIFFHDITPRKKAEHLLTESEKRFRTTLDNLQEGCQIVDLDFQYIYLNSMAEKHNRNTKEMMIGRTMMEVYPGIEELEFFKQLQECNRQRKSHKMQIEFQFADGYIGWYDVNIEPIPEGIFILSSDISEKIKAEQALEQYHNQLHALAGHLQVSIEQERARISREIHDDLGQTVSALRMDLSMLKKSLELSHDISIREVATSEIPGMTKMIDEVVLSMRKIIRDLRPEVLDTLGVIGGLRWQAEEFQRRTNIPCILEIPKDDIPFDSERSTAIFRIVQEALTNITRHAEATAVGISLSITEQFLTLTIKDNGKGISENERSKINSFGLMGMMERIRAFNGTMVIEGAEGKGTRLFVTIPLEIKR